jgi:glycosyltransferase involved in cell wall biosynthesis
MAKDEFEVIVVDNGSTDHTAFVVRQFTNALQLSSVSAPEPGLHIGRHAGMRHAQSDVLLFADDDIEAGPHWVATVAEGFADPLVAMIGGNNHPLFEMPPPAWLSRWWDQPVARGRALGHLSILDFGEGRFDIDPGYVWGCNFSIRRDVLLAANGFHPDAVPREQLRFRGDGETHVSDMVRRSGRRTLFDSRASVHHRVSKDRMTTAYFEQRAYAQGISDSYTDIRRSGGLARRSRDWIRRHVRQGRELADRRLRMASLDPTAQELRSVQAAAAAAYRRGYAYHRIEARKDPALLAWVLRDNYL